MKVNCCLNMPHKMAVSAVLKEIAGVESSSSVPSSSGSTFQANSRPFRFMRTRRKLSFINPSRIQCFHVYNHSPNLLHDASPLPRTHKKRLIFLSYRASSLTKPQTVSRPYPSMNKVHIIIKGYPAKSPAHIPPSASRLFRIFYNKSTKSQLCHMVLHVKNTSTSKGCVRSAWGKAIYILFLPLDEAAIKNIHLLFFLPFPSLLPLPFLRLLVVILSILHPALSILVPTLPLTQILQRRARASLLTERAMKDNDILLCQILRYLRKFLVEQGGWDIYGGMDVAADVVVVADVDDCDR